MMLQRVLGEIFALICALMLGLAAGALWLVPMVMLRRPLPELALLAGWILAFAIRQWVHGRKWNVLLLAWLATALACAYVRVLTVAANIAAMMGFGLVETMHTAGYSMLLGLAGMKMTTADIGWYVAGLVVASVVSLRATARKR
jgi:vitamin B12 transport system permease protein